MAGTIPTDLKFYKYVVESFDILFPGEPKPVSVPTGLIESIIIEKDFDDRYFPVFRVNISLEPTLYNRIIDQQFETRFRVRLMKYIFDSKNTLKIKQDVFNSIFITITDNATPFLNKKMYEKSKDDEKNRNPVTMGGNVVSLFLYNESDIINTGNLNNGVLTSASMTDTIAYLFTINSINNVLMSPLNNSATYSEVIIPPFTLLGNLDYFENLYGFYNKGSLIFFDIDRKYLIDRDSKCTAWAPGEYKKTVFHIKNAINSDRLTPGSIDDGTNKYTLFNVLHSNVNFTSGSVIQNHTDGNNLMIITPSTGSAQHVRTNTKQRGNGIFKTLINKYNNPYIVQAEKTKREENSLLLQTTVGDFDISSLTPNKEFSVIFEEKDINADYGGSYRLSRVAYTFMKSGEEFAISGNVTLKKI